MKSWFGRFEPAEPSHSVQVVNRNPECKYKVNDDVFARFVELEDVTPIESFRQLPKVVIQPKNATSDKSPIGNAPNSVDQLGAFNNDLGADIVRGIVVKRSRVEIFPQLIQKWSDAGVALDISAFDQIIGLPVKPMKEIKPSDLLNRNASSILVHEFFHYKGFKRRYEEAQRQFSRPLFAFGGAQYNENLSDMLEAPDSEEFAIRARVKGLFAELPWIHNLITVE